MSTPEDAAGSPVELSSSECWGYVRRASVGRLAVVVDGHPDIFPINYAVDHGTVVFRSADGTKLAAALADAPVAFEVDGYDDGLALAWSVVLKGTASALDSIEDVLHSETLQLVPWQTGEKNHFVRIEPIETSGRRFRVNEAARNPAAPAPRRQAAAE